MMNYHLKNLPERTKKTRDKGLTMVIDKGSSINECKNLIESSGEFIDLVKFGWSTSLLTKDLVKKINMFKKLRYQFILVELYLKPLSQEINLKIILMF